MSERDRRIRQLKKEIAELENELNLPEQSLDQLDSRVSELDDEVFILRDRLDDAEDELSDLTQLRDLKKELNNLDPPFVPAKRKHRENDSQLHKFLE